MSSDIPAAPPPAASAPRRPPWVLIAIGVAVVGCLCIALVAALAGRAVLGVSEQRSAIAPTLDQFMQLMVLRDSEGALRLFSSRAQRQMALRDIEELTEGENYVLFDGYQSLSVESISINSTVNTDPDVPQGQVATVSGDITYAGDVRGSYEATLELEQGDWRLHAINITVPPSKQLR